MKRVLWICNIMLPVIAKELGLPYSNREGWLTGIFNQLAGEKDKEIELGICFPVTEWTKELTKENVSPIVVNGVPCYGFMEDLAHPECYDAAMEESFAEIMADFKPDILHIFGTEFPHALAAERAFGRPEKTLVGIQGLCGEIAKVYQAGLSDEVYKKRTFRDIIRKDSLMQQQEKFTKRGELEKEIIKLAGHITGRTRFDREETAKINPKAVYHAMNETMRAGFYEGAWSLAACEKHSIFFGQGDYPLKGFHFMLEAMPHILQKYPDAKLYVAGNSIMNYSTVKDKLKISAYGKYLLSLVKKHRLEDKVIITGRLTEEEMKERFLKANVFVCASVLENSPNTVGEAMLLGVPVVASRAGGIPDMITDGVDGLLFESRNAQMLAEKVLEVFAADKDAENKIEVLSYTAKERAARVHDGAANYGRLLEIYEEMGA